MLRDFGLEMLQGLRESKLQKVSQPMEMWQERAGDPGCGWELEHSLSRGASGACSMGWESSKLLQLFVCCL